MFSLVSDSLFVYAAPSEGRALAATPASVRRVEFGVGAARAAMNLTRALMLGPPPARVVVFGVCGVYPARVTTTSTGLGVGDLCLVTHDTLADEGVDTEAGFVTATALGLCPESAFASPPALAARAAAALGMPCVRGATVSTCSGNDARARALVARTGAGVETMEGAAVAMVCARFGLPWLQVRAVSNFCGDRAQGAWDLERAVAALLAVMPRIVTLE